MKRKARAIFDPFSAFFSTESLINSTGQKLLLPFYHAVSNEELPHISNLYSLRTVNEFKADIDFLLKHYTPVTIEELHQIIAEKRVLSKPIFHLTFDDGLKEFKTIIAPILKEKGIPATVFLNTDFIDNKNLFYRYKISLIIDKINQDCTGELLQKTSLLLNMNSTTQKDIVNKIFQLSYFESKTIKSLANIWGVNFQEYLKNQQPYLNTKDIIELENSGFTFGSHSCDHPLFNTLDVKEQRKQVLDSLYFLKEKLGFNIRYFSFPFTDDGVSNSFIEWLHNSENLQLTFGTAGLKKDISPNHLQRIPMEGNHLKAKQIIHSEYLYFLLKRLFNKNKINRR